MVPIRAHPGTDWDASSVWYPCGRRGYWTGRPAVRLRALVTTHSSVPIWLGAGLVPLWPQLDPDLRVFPP
eukprot:2335548-Rhodomonas_salina.1